MFFEEVEVGKVYAAPDVKIITETEIDLVAQLSGLNLPGFLDPEAAKEWGFRDRVTPGPYLIACAIGLMSKQGFLADAVWVSGNEIAFKTPVFPRDRVSARVEVIEKKEKKRGGGAVTYRWWLTNHKGETCVEGVNT